MCWQLFNWDIIRFTEIYSIWFWSVIFLNITRFYFGSPSCLTWIVPSYVCPYLSLKNIEKSNCQLCRLHSCIPNRASTPQKIELRS